MRRKRRKDSPEQVQDAPEALRAAGGSNATDPAVRRNSKDTRIDDEAALFRQFQEEAKMLEKEAHECPVPKPGGVLGRLLGFQQDGDRKNIRQEKRKGLS